MQEDYKRGEATTRDLVEYQTAHHGAGHQRTLYSLALLGNILGYQRRYDEALTILANAVTGLTASLGPNDAKTLQALHNLAAIHFEQKRYDEAAAEWGDILARLTARGEAKDEFTSAIQVGAAMALQLAGKPAQAEAIYRSALSDARGFTTNDAPRVQYIRYNLASCLLDLHRVKEAEPLLADLDRVALNRAEPEPDWDGRLAYEDGRVALENGNHAAAIPLLETAAQIITDKNPNGHISPDAIRKLVAQAKSPIIAADRAR
jgi:eukaryotic-like serine/threonine-protein kinase